MCLGIPGKIISATDEDQKLALVDISGVKREVNIACVLEPGQTVADVMNLWVLVHVGFALSILDEEEAQKTLSILKELGEAQEELNAIQDSAV